jgi:anti-sigma factor RsiW
MSVSETELELLESYLDGELPDEQADALRIRIAADPVLAQAIEALRAERSTRAMFWRSCEPDDEVVARLIGRVEKQVDDHWIWTSRLSKLRFASAAAACILIGWIGRGMIQTRPPAGPVVENTVAQVSNNESKGGPVELPITDEYGRVVAVQHFDSAEQAKEFVANDFRQWQEKQEQGPVVPVSAPEKF